MRLSAAAVSAAAALGFVLAMGFGPTGATAAPSAPVDLASAVRSVSDPASARYRHFETPAQVASYMPTALWGAARSAFGGGSHLVYPQRIGAGKPSDSKACSRYFGQFAASAYPPSPKSAGAAKDRARADASSARARSAAAIEPRSTSKSPYPAARGSVAPLAVCGYTPDQLRSAYDTDGEGGAGVTVAILGAYASPAMPGDADEYAENHGDAGFREGQYTQYATPGAWTLRDQCGADPWAAEQTLDVEAVHAMAPRAGVLYVGANSCQDSDMLAALAWIVGNRMADVVTGSWGSPLHSAGGDEPTEVIALYERLFQIAALEGITVDFAAGDCGAEAPDTGCGRRIGSTRAQTTFPASDPWVTAVGGTSLAIGADGETLWQAAWGTRAWELQGSAWKPLGWVFGGGGGASEDFAQPWYQAGRVSTALARTLLTGKAAASPRRVVPDISLDADPFTGMLIGQTRSDSGGPVSYGESPVGGTSLAAPLLAGLVADMAARADVEGPVRRGLGFLDPVLYLLAGTRYLTDVTAALGSAGQVFPPIPGVPAVFAAFGDDGPLAAGPGYDSATGLGAPGEDFTEALDRFNGL